MKIYKDIIILLLNIKPAPPESGGILGGRDNKISEVMFDAGNSGDEKCYSPNTDFLNQTISNWQKDNIEFYGIFHTHPVGYNELSKGDVDYINKIFRKCRVKKLYFPVVTADKVTAYQAQMQHDNIRISEESIIMIER